MKDKNPNVCPGCSRHCAAGAVRCKRGRKYFAELDQPKSAPASVRSAKQRKWEQHVAAGGLLWRLLTASRSIKQLLRSGVSEERLLAALSDVERGRLEEILDKIDLEIKKFS